jgi:hypothetical protein
MHGANYHPLDTLIVSKSIRFCFRLRIRRVKSCAKQSIFSAGIEIADSC